jgi:cytidylate kinase
MAVWTIDAQPEAGGRAIAGELAARAGVPLIDHQFAVALALSFGISVQAASAYEHQLSTMTRHGLVVGMASSVAPGVAAELCRVERAREVLNRVACEAARGSCVIFGRCAFEALADHPGAIHVHLRAPFAWRVERAAAAHLVARTNARRELRRIERRQRRLARWLLRYRRRAAPFHVVCDVSRLSETAIVEMLLAVGGQAGAQLNAALRREAGG